MAAQASPPPHLQLDWAELYRLDGLPAPVALSPSSISRKTLPSAMYPASHDYNDSMRKHEQAMVESFKQRRSSLAYKDSFSEPPLSLADRFPPSSRVEGASAANPQQQQQLSVSKLPAPSLTLPLPDRTLQRRSTMVAESRSILLSGVSRPEMNTLSSAAGRRNSVPSPGLLRRGHGRGVHKQLRSWGSIRYGNTNHADVFVCPVAIRRNSLSDGSRSASNGAVTSNCIYVRARIRPYGQQRKPFLLQRSFDIDDMRATITSSMPALLPATGAGVSPISPLSFAPRRESTSARLEVFAPDTAPWLGMDADASKRSVPGAGGIPIHLHYARCRLPVLAALMLSGHVHRGDTIDLPLPFPESWARTVVYVYTGNGELTDAMKQNILYLAGKV